MKTIQLSKSDIEIVSEIFCNPIKVTDKNTKKLSKLIDLEIVEKVGDDYFLTEFGCKINEVYLEKLELENDD